MSECHKCGSISGVYYDLCDACMTRLNMLEARVKELEEMILDLGHCPICGWRKDICEHASKWQATGGAE